MVADIRVDLRDQGVGQALQQLRLGLPLGGSMLPAMQGIGRALKTGTQLRFRSGTAPDGSAWEKSWRAKNQGGQTLSLTRRLRNSITSEATHDSVAVGTNVLYAAIHQFGGVIRAKAGPFLAIPVTDAARRAGSPRNMAGLHVVQTIKNATQAGGQFLLVDEKGTTHFLLRHQVTMPARPFLGVSTSDRAELIGVVERYLQARWQP